MTWRHNKVMDMRVVDFRKVQKRWLILVVEDVYETRAGIDTLLKAKGYRVALASTEGAAINSTWPERPDLILVSGSGLPNNVLAKVDRLRKEAAVGDEVPVVVFCARDIPEGEEVAIGGNVYLTNPDNFNQLRSLVARLLPESAHGGVTNEEETLEFMTSNNIRAPFVIRFIATRPRILLEITNTAESTLKSVEILTVFLKDEEGPASPSRAHIQFDPIKSVQPNEKAVVAHRTWINGRPASDAQDQIGRLEIVAGAAKPYVLDISWEDVDGKMQFQRIPVGH
jgi:DNA-binding response OmpR family regulator